MTRDKYYKGRSSLPDDGVPLTQHKCEKEGVFFSLSLSLQVADVITRCGNVLRHVQATLRSDAAVAGEITFRRQAWCTARA